MSTEETTAAVAQPGDSATTKPSTTQQEQPQETTNVVNNTEDVDAETNPPPVEMSDNVAPPQDPLIQQNGPSMSLTMSAVQEEEQPPQDDAVTKQPTTSTDSVLSPTDLVSLDQPTPAVDVQQQQEAQEQQAAQDKNDGTLDTTTNPNKRALPPLDEDTTSTTTTTTTTNTTEDKAADGEEILLSASSLTRRRLNNGTALPTNPTTTTTTTTTTAPPATKSGNGPLTGNASSQRLLTSQYRQLANNLPSGISSIVMDPANVFRWTVVLLGPPDTPYNGGVFPCHLTFPPDYPEKPPVFKFTTPNFIHPNVFPDGRVCISILHDATDHFYDSEPASERWKPVLGVEAILMSITSLLSEPNLDSPANVDVAKIYRTDRREYQKRIVMMVRKSQKASFGEDNAQ